MPSVTKSRPSRLPSAGLGQYGHVTGGPVAEPEVGADHDGGGVQQVDQDAVDELLGGPAGHLAGEGQDEDRVRPGVGEECGSLVDRGEGRRCVVWPQHGHRVRVEGHRDDRQPALVGDLPGRGR